MEVERAASVVVPLLDVPDDDRVLHREPELLGQQRDGLPHLRPRGHLLGRYLEMSDSMAAAPGTGILHHVVERLLRALDKRDALVRLAAQDVVGRRLCTLGRGQAGALDNHSATPCVVAVICGLRA